MKFSILSKYGSTEILAFVMYMKCVELGKKPNLTFIAKVNNSTPYKLRMLLSDTELCKLWGLSITEAEIQPDKPKREPKKEEVSQDEMEVLFYLNLKTGKNFTTKNEKNMGFIRSRFSDGYSIEQMKSVIDRKVADWRGTTYDKFLRPETLFNKTKFENYLNERAEQRKPNGSIQTTANAIQQAQSVDWGMDS